MLVKTIAYPVVRILSGPWLGSLGAPSALDSGCFACSGGHARLPETVASAKIIRGSNLDDTGHLVLEIQHLTRPGLAPVDISLAKGECITVSGPSGSGKSILMRAIADLDPNTGEVSLDGRPRDAVPAPDWRRAVVYVPAEAGWWADRVVDHFPDPDIAAPLIIRLGLPADALGWEITRLSTGEKQRLALTRAFLTAPKVLLLDEPTSGLDPEATAKVESMLHELIGQGVAVIMVTHDGAQAARLEARRYAMEKGLLRALDTPVAKPGAGGAP